MKEKLARKMAQKPLFRSEGPGLYNAALKHNARWATKGPWKTNLSAPQEQRFDRWFHQHHIGHLGFKPNRQHNDYDMRGFWLHNQGANIHGLAKNSGHFPDRWKTPFDTTFSNQSKYAKLGTPFVWRGNRLINRKNGRVIFK